MYAIRGATTVQEDCPSQIKEAVKEMLWEIVKRNQISQNDMISILFSSTEDVVSFYPAKAAREAGFFLPALYSSVEPEIQGSLRHCIRVLVLVEGDKKPCHVYLKEAKRLRKDISSSMTIALDGPAGSGKSTIAKRIAADYGILYLDTGAMYRACALYCRKHGVSFDDEASVSKIVADIPLTVSLGEGQITMLNGEDVSLEIRHPDIASGASSVARYASVREKMVALQREIASKQSCVLDGRDIGTTVLPNANYKFYITASSSVRAERRCADLAKMGLTFNFEEIKAGIEQRDEQDMNRAVSPLKKAVDAILVDTSLQTIEETLLTIHSAIQEKI